MDDKCIKNEFGFIEGINYKTEYAFHRFSLDFAFVDEKVCIEVDGKQHKTDKKQQERDANKDCLLIEEGWRELRIPWVECCNDTQKWINIIKEFLTGV